MLAGLLGATASNPVPPAVAEVEQDPRLTRLDSYLARINSPIRHLAKDFLAAADRHTLDWRLLPSIAVVESSAGKSYQNNNIFGWDSGKTRFQSIKAGIHTVADRLANSRIYRNKRTQEILRTYNPRPEYSTRVLRVMRTLGPPESQYQN